MTDCTSASTSSFAPVASTSKLCALDSLPSRSTSTHSLASEASGTLTPYEFYSSPTGTPPNESGSSTPAFSPSSALHPTSLQSALTSLASSACSSPEAIPTFNTTRPTPGHSPLTDRTNLEPVQSRSVQNATGKSTNGSEYGTASSSLYSDDSMEVIALPSRSAEAQREATRRIPKRAQSLPALNAEADAEAESSTDFLRQLSEANLGDTFAAAQRAKAEKRANRSERRYRALLELVTTEQGYVQDLRILVAVYFNTLTFTTFTTPEVRTAIKRNADALLEYHEKLSDAFAAVDTELAWRGDLRGQADVWDDAKVMLACERIAGVMVQEAHGLQLYKSFCSQHHEAMLLLRACAHSRVDWEPYERNCTAQIKLLVPTEDGSGRLKLDDYAIKPIQRICRYPMLFNVISRQLDADVPEEAAAACTVSEALACVKQAAAHVDQANHEMDIERRTKTVAQRLEMPAATLSAFLSVLGQVQLVGALHCIELSATADTNVKAKYYGALLYATHLVLVKAKRPDCYEPRHWLPLRAFELELLSDDEGLMPYSIRLRHRTFQIELSASCSAERNLWAQRIISRIDATRRDWAAAQKLDDKEALFDDTCVSSVSIRSPLASPSDEALAEDTLNRASIGPQGSLAVRSRIAQTAFTLLGRTPTSARATIDLRLADVFSDDCLKARMPDDVVTSRRSPATRPLKMRAESHKSSASFSGSSLLQRRTTTKDFGSTEMSQRRRSFADASQPEPVRPKEHRRRMSADVVMGTSKIAEESEVALGLTRSKTSGGELRQSNTAVATPTPILKRSWTGTLRHRTLSLLSVSTDSVPLEAEPASVARNGSASSSSSSTQPHEIHTPSPVSSAPPSPSIAQDTWYNGGIRDVFTSLSRKASFSSTKMAGPTLGSAAQDEQATFANQFLYESGKPPVSSWKESWKSKRSSAPPLSRRQNSASSLLGMFRPVLSPTLSSPVHTDTSMPSIDAAMPEASPAPKKRETSSSDDDADQLSIRSSIGPARPGLTVRRRSMKSFRQLTRMTAISSTTN